MMLSKMTLLHSSSICWTIIGATTHKPPLVCNCRANYELTVEIIVLGQCLANAARQNDALPTTPLPNVTGPTIACYNVSVYV